MTLWRVLPHSFTCFLSPRPHPHHHHLTRDKLFPQLSYDRVYCFSAVKERLLVLFLQAAANGAPPMVLSASLGKKPPDLDIE